MPMSRALKNDLNADFLGVQRLRCYTLTAGPRFGPWSGPGAPLVAQTCKESASSAEDLVREDPLEAG